MLISFNSPGRYSSTDRSLSLIGKKKVGFGFNHEDLIRIEADSAKSCEEIENLGARAKMEMDRKIRQDPRNRDLINAAAQRTRQEKAQAEANKRAEEKRKAEIAAEIAREEFYNQNPSLNIIRNCIANPECRQVLEKTPLVSCLTNSREENGKTDKEMRDYLETNPEASLYDFIKNKYTFKEHTPDNEQKRRTGKNSPRGTDPDKDIKDKATNPAVQAVMGIIRMESGF